MVKMMPLLFFHIFFMFLSYLPAQSKFADRIDFGLGYGAVYIGNQPDMINVSTGFLLSIWGDYYFGDIEKKNFSSSIGLDFRQELIITNGIFKDGSWEIPDFLGSASHIRQRQIGVPAFLYLNMDKNEDARLGIGYRPSFLLRSIYRFTDINNNQDSFKEITSDTDLIHHDLVIQAVFRQKNPNPIIPVQSFKLVGSIGINKWQRNGYRPFTLQIMIGLL